MPAPIPEDKRAAIIADIRARQLSSRGIAAKHGVSGNTVSRFAKQAGITDAFSREYLKRATEVRLAEARELRAQTSLRLLTMANELLNRVNEPALVYSFGGRENTYNEHTLERPSPADARNLMTSAAIALDKHVVLDRHDTDNGAAGAVSMLGALARGLEAAHRQATKPTTEEPDADPDRP